MTNYLKALRNMDKDDLLNLVGLETRRTTADWLVPTLTAFSVGVLVGAGIGLMLAPKSGSELREDLRNRMTGGGIGAGTGPGSFAPGSQPPTGATRTL
jgi:hypothetical protein